MYIYHYEIIFRPFSRNQIPTHDYFVRSCYLYSTYKTVFSRSNIYTINRMETASILMVREFIIIHTPYMQYPRSPVRTASEGKIEKTGLVCQRTNSTLSLAPPFSPSLTSTLSPVLQK